MLDYRDLLQGTPRQRAAYHALRSLGVFEVLHDASPLLVGTIPIDIDIPGSDLDIICELDDADAFARRVTTHFGGYEGFTLRRGQRDNLPLVVANWVYGGFPVELFAQPRPVRQQNAYLHMVVEHRLLCIGGEPARRAIRRLKRDGLKTEPAFARYFGLTGDPYARLLELARLDDETLRRTVSHHE